MSIIQVPIQELITNLISNTGNLNNNTDQVANAGMFGNLMKEVQALEVNGNIASPVLREIILKSIQNSEVSEQIKTALASGGVVSLGVNNTKDTLNSLLQISQELNSILSPENIQQQPLSINIEKLLDSMQIKDVVVDNQAVSQVVEKFLQQIEDLFKNVIQLADTKDIPNIGDLVKLLKEVKSELKSELTGLLEKDNKQIVIDFSKIKILLPEDETDNTEKTDNLTPINLIVPVINMEEKPIIDETQIYQEVQIIAPREDEENKPIEIVNNNLPPAPPEEVPVNNETEVELLNIDPVMLDLPPAPPILDAEIPVMRDLPPVLPVVEANVPVMPDLSTVVPVVDTDIPVMPTLQPAPPVVEANTPVNSELPPIQPEVNADISIKPEMPPVQPIVNTNIPVNNTTEAVQPEDNKISASTVQVVKLDPATTEPVAEASQSQPAEIKGRITLDVPANADSKQPVQEEIKNIELPEAPPKPHETKVVDNNPVENKPIDNKSIESKSIDNKPVQTDKNIVNNTVAPQAESVETTKTEAAPAAEPVKITTAIKEALNRVINKVLDNVKSTKAASNETDIQVKVSEEMPEIETGINPKLLEKIQLIQNTSPEVLKEVEVKVTPDVNVIEKLDNILDKTLNSIKNLLVQELNQSDKTSLDIQKLDNILKQALKPVMDNAEALTDSKEIKINLPNMANKVVLDNPVIAPVQKDQSIPVARLENATPQTPQTPANNIANQVHIPQQKEGIKAEPPAIPNNKQAKTLTEALKNISEKIKVTDNLKTNSVETVKNPEAIKLQKDVAKTDKIEPQTQTQNDLSTEKTTRKPLINTLNAAGTTIDKNITTNKLNNLANQALSKEVIQAKQSVKHSSNTEKETITKNTENKTTETTTSKANSDLSTHNLFKFLMNSNQDPALIGLRSAKGFMFTDTALNINNNLPIRTKDDVVNQVIEKIRSSLNKSELTINLRPNNLGDVNVSISMQRGVLQASIVTETARAMESLKSGLDSLKQTLVESGINVDKIVVQTSEKSTFTGGNNPNSDQQSNMYKDQQASNGQQQQDRSANKDIDFNLFKQSQNGKHSRHSNTTNPNANTKDNLTDTITNNTTAKPETNYINTDTGRVNYRI